MKVRIKIWILNATYSIWHPAVVEAIGRAKEGPKFDNNQYIHILSYLDRSQSNYAVEKSVKS